ncbi:hypothetical protein DFA_06896 [Cavenderia fasciculata]|uniref:Transmembrane protein n=1 Tax=Cavenderia fasciculata TaxID=261658 RepID=F4PWZ1_CACFS|nr:uncharacterized protein DFA_06896 [Cavenderia fasciculata]EGG19794.1 hypothetical protein DFA_06896 [Cavenderia fasciculata]|eukprot:XP_004358140.1 hypothetical protein DFA_06896 [Cavenderia fasciculata]
MGMNLRSLTVSDKLSLLILLCSFATFAVLIPSFIMNWYSILGTVQDPNDETNAQVKWLQFSYTNAQLYEYPTGARKGPATTLRESNMKNLSSLMGVSLAFNIVAWVISIIIIISIFINRVIGFKHFTFAYIHKYLLSVAFLLVVISAFVVMRIPGAIKEDCSYPNDKTNDIASFICSLCINNTCDKYPYGVGINSSFGFEIGWNFTVSVVPIVLSGAIALYLTEVNKDKKK